MTNRFKAGLASAICLCLMLAAFALALVALYFFWDSIAAAVVCGVVAYSVFAVPRILYRTWKEGRDSFLKNFYGENVDG